VIHNLEVFMKRRIAEILLNLDAVALRVDPPFTWASGRYSPVYCDNRLLMSSPQSRKEVARGFVSLIKQNRWEPDVIAGTATAGIPHAAWVADLMNLPMIYIRGAAKSHGKTNKIEGRLEPGQQVVLIEDLISTGGSSLNAAGAIIGNQASLKGIAAIFTYGLKTAEENFNTANISVSTLTDFATLMELAKENGSLTDEQKQIIVSWQADPSEWSKKRGGA
jgi:orotate phosphoribosyltransferase